MGLLLLVPSGGAADRYWRAASGGNFNLNSRWDNGVPGPADNAVFPIDGTFTVNWPSGFSAINVSTWFTASNGTVVLDVNTSFWQLTNSFVVGQGLYSTASVILASGTLRVTNATRSALLEARYGRFQMDGDLIEADQLVETNSNTQVDYLAPNPRLAFNSGTLITRGGHVRGNLVVGSGGSSPATLDVRSNQTLMVDSLLLVGRSTANSRLYITNGGTLHTVNSAYIGVGSVSNSAVVSGPDSLWQGDGSVRVGVDSQYSRLWVTNGGKIRSNRGSVGYSFSVSGDNEAVISDPGSSWSLATTFAVGDTSSSSNRMLLTNQAAVMATDVSIGSGGGSGNHLTVAGGATLRATNSLQIVSSNNFLTVAGGNVFTTNVSRSGLTHLRNGTTRFEAGMWLADRFWNDGSNSTLLFHGGTLQARSISNHLGSVFTVGNGTQPATLWLLSTGRHDFRNGLLISSLGTLVGNGLIVGDVTNATGGTLAPGESIGALTVRGHLTFASGGTSVFELHKALGTNDTIVGISNLVLGGTLVVTNLGGTLGAGDSFKLFDAQAYAGAFDNLTLPPLSGDLYWNNRLALDGSLSVESLLPTDCYWTNLLSLSYAGIFSAPTNWLAHRPPGAMDTAIFTNPVSHQILFSAPAQVANVWFNGGTGGVASTTMNLGGNSWTVTNQFVVGRSISARAGFGFTNGWLHVTNPAGTAQLIVGQDGHGNFSVNGGDVAVDHLIATNNVGIVENSRVNLSYGTLTTRRGALIHETPQNFSFGIGTSSSSTMTWKMLGGTNTTDCSPVDSLLLGDGGRGIVWVDGPFTLWTNVGPSVSLNDGSSVVVTNGARVLLNGSVSVGSSPIGSRPMSNSLTVTEGGLLASPFGSLGGPTNGSQNRALITGPGSVWLVQSLTVGNFGSSNQIVISNNAVVATRGLVVGSAATASSNVVVVEGGTLLVTNATANAVLELGRNGGGVLRLRSGHVTADRLLATNSPAGNLDFSGGVLRPGSVWFSNNTTFVVGNGVSPATLDLSSGGTNLFARGLSVSSGGGLNGRGLIVGHLTNASGGTLAIGPGLDRLRLQGDFVLQPGSTTSFKLNKALGTNDTILSVSNVVLGGTLVLTNLAGTVAPGDSFKLFSASNYSGAFSAISPAFAGPGLTWDVSTLAVDGTLRVAIATPPSLRLSYFEPPNNQVLRFQVSNGQPGQLVCLLSTTNVGLPLTNWTVLASNVFGANGQLEGYVVPNEPARFYLLELK